MCKTVNFFRANRIGSLLPTEEINAKFAQLYIIDPAVETAQRESKCFPDNTNENITKLMKGLQYMMHKHNPYVKQFKNTAELAQSTGQDFDLILKASPVPKGNQKVIFRKAIMLPHA